MFDAAPPVVVSVPAPVADYSIARPVPEIEQIQRDNGWVDQRIRVRVRFPF